jgi:hypothetical protein
MRQLISFYPLSPILHIVVCLLFTCCCCVSASPARHTWCEQLEGADGRTRMPMTSGLDGFAFHATPNYFFSLNSDRTHSLGGVSLKYKSKYHEP